MVPARRQSAFTMLELLVVVAIMAILAAMILVGAGTIMGDAEKKKTDTIIQTVRQGIELAIANKGSAISPTEHPFAGSRLPRYKFKRIDPAQGSVSVNGLAYKGLTTVEVLPGGERDKLLLGTDRFADDRVPLLYGALRQEIGVLQSLRKVVTKYRLLPMPPRAASGTSWGPIISPATGKAPTNFNDANRDIDHPDFPNSLIPTKYQDLNKNFAGQPVPPYGLLSDTKLALDYLFGNSNAQAELASLKAIYNADPSLPLEANTYKTGIESRSVGGDTEALVYTNYGTQDQSDSKTTKGKYEAGYISVTNASGTSPISLDKNGDTWVKYRLGGMAVYDAWGNELMTVTGTNNSYLVISAGLDGVLAINPGKNLEFDTKLDGDLLNLTFEDDDKDGAKDNQK